MRTAGNPSASPKSLIVKPFNASNHITCARVPISGPTSTCVCDYSSDSLNSVSSISPRVIERLNDMIHSGKKLISAQLEGGRL